MNPKIRFFGNVFGTFLSLAILTSLVSQPVFSLESFIIYGKYYVDPGGLINIFAFFLPIPVLLIPLVSMLGYGVLRKKIPEKLRVLSLLLIYVICLFIFLNPLILNAFGFSFSPYFNSKFFNPFWY